MPAGLFKSLKPDDRRDLLGYLMHGKSWRCQQLPNELIPALQEPQNSLVRQKYRRNASIQRALQPDSTK
jgi:hypothetical protein